MAGGLRLLAGKLRTAAAQLRYLPRALRMVRDAAGGWVAAWLALLIVQGLVPVAVAYLTRPLVEGLAAAVHSSGEGADVAPTLMLAAAMAGVILLGELLRGGADWVRIVQAKRVEDHVSSLIHEQSTRVDLAFYESPEFHDHLHRARHEARYRPVALLESLGGLLQNGITLIAMAAVLLSFGWWMSLALLASTLPALLVVLHFAIRQHRWRQRTTSEERRASYLDWLMTAGETASELRLFGLGARLRDAYRAVRAGLRGEELQLARDEAFAELFATTFALLLAAACLAWVLWRAMRGEIGLGDVALFYVAFGQGQRLMRTLLGGVGRIYYNILFLGGLFEFLDLESRVADPARPRPLEKMAAAASGLAVRFRRVTFRYPASERIALEDLELAFAPGQVAAIVGANGAGKSTLVKLLCRFYDPDAGRIELGGTDLRELGLDDLRAAITVLFQEPVRYNATVSENIAPGAPAASRRQIEAAARAAGADELVERLPRGYDTLLGRWFDDGVQLSVGEWQRLALARAFMRPSPVVILDEPTSAMDSWAEADWLQRFRTLASGRTTIIITHRFTTAMQADVIHVMDRGRVVESGSHAQLVSRRGAYSRSWRAQMRADEGNAA
jgi:ATP-binding cassette subfamily B protein